MVPGRPAAWLKFYESDGLPIHTRHLGKPVGVFTSEVGTLNQVVFLFAYADHADRERRRSALEADPDRIAYRKHTAETGHVQHQENKIIRAAAFSSV